jgi:hypothetical protein
LKDYKEHDWSQMKEEDETKPVYFLGELVCFLNTVISRRAILILLQVLPDMFEDYTNLRLLKGVAALLAEYDSWPDLYDLEQLARNKVKVSAAT